MQVEVYESQELNEAGVGEYDTEEGAAAFAARVERLGLKGQQRLVGKQEKRGTVLAFRPMTADESFIYGVMLTNRVKVEDYAGEAIPLRVLDVLERARSGSQFQRIEVWSPADDRQVKDPLLVGMAGQKEWDVTPFPLARWGEALAPIAELGRQALATWKAAARLALLAIKARADSELSLIDNVTIDAANGLAARGWQGAVAFPEPVGVLRTR